MNKKQVIEGVYNALEEKVPFKTAEKAVNATLELIAQGLETDGQVILTQFGKFDVKQIPTRTGRNPQTGALIAIPAHKRCVFHAGNTLRERINKK